MTTTTPAAVLAATIEKALTDNLPMDVTFSLKGASIFDALKTLREMAEGAQGEAVAEVNWTRDGIADFIADNWPDRKHTLAEIDAGIRAIEIRPNVAAPVAAKQAEPTCTCPSGDGSLRWPCPAHPPAPAAVAPDGWVMVPRKLTREMIDAYLAQNGRFHSARSDWDAMLDAAPTPPASTDRAMRAEGRVPVASVTHAVGCGPNDVGIRWRGSFAKPGMLLYAEQEPEICYGAANQRSIAAVASLESLGFTYHGGEKWKPPLGATPTWAGNDEE